MISWQILTTRGSYVCCSLFPGMIGGGVLLFCGRRVEQPQELNWSHLWGSLSCWKGSMIKSSNFVIEAVRGMGQEWV